MKMKIFIPAFLLLCTIFPEFSAFSQCREMYGVVSGGGQFNSGAIFKTDEKGENLTFVHSIERKRVGESPRGDLCEADNGILYGMTMNGGGRDDAGFFLNSILLPGNMQINSSFMGVTGHIHRAASFKPGTANYTE